MAEVPSSPKVGGTALSLAGTYTLRLQFGKQDIELTPSALRVVEVVEYLDKLLPSISITLNDSMGVLTHFMALDSRYNTITLMFSNPALETDGVPKQKWMTFRIWRKNAESVTQMGNYVTFNGLLDVKNAISPRYQKGWEKKTISSIIQDVALEMGIDRARVKTDTGLNKTISIVQPNWSNVVFLRYLEERMVSASGVGFFCWIDSPAGEVPSETSAGKPRLNFKTMSQMVQYGTAKKTFKFGKSPDPELLPIFTFEPVDNFELINTLGIEEDEYNYYDYENGKFVTEKLKITDEGMPILSEYISYDKSIGTKGLQSGTSERTTDLIQAYDQKTFRKGFYYKRINALNRIWINTMGVTDVNCGDVIKLVCSDDVKMVDYQYTGFWLIQRIIHHISGNIYLTRMLLTRPGLDSTDPGCTLMKANPLEKKTQPLGKKR